MSVWKEIRCDAVPTAPDCLSNDNRGPYGFEPVAELHAQARKQGWRIGRDGATCPACRKHEKDQPHDHR